MDELSKELQVQLGSFLMMLINLHNALVSLQGLLEAYLAYLNFIKNKRRRVVGNKPSYLVVNLDEDVYFRNHEGSKNNSSTPQPPTNNIQYQSDSSIQNQSRSRKRKANSNDALIGSLIDSVNNIGTICESMGQGIRYLSSFFKRLSEGDECQQKVYEGLLAIEDLGLDETQMVDVGENIASSRSTSKYFFSLPMSVKKTFVWRKLSLI
ncbi:hypothetical protein Cni_G26811 [Canna indica]|uniref:Uncharacterized protein n=1 Tax=Canna indica TaxID=4628 RepID=A0AAQ3L048_9LILI|nr:hypothetical protein Cni_G26811 [Canna indica]